MGVGAGGCNGRAVGGMVGGGGRCHRWRVADNNDAINLGACSRPRFFESPPARSAAPPRRIKLPDTRRPAFKMVVKDTHAHIIARAV